jgi:heme/copper-type cytochrome/quinol oxidase subunit 2
MKLPYLLLILLFSAGLVACSTQTTTQSGTPTTPTDSGAQGNVVADGTPVADAQSGNTVVINMTAKDFSFTPNAIHVKQGDHVIINIVDSDDDHGLAIQGYDQQMHFGEGNEGKSLDFIASKAGTFTFYCNVPCGPGHRNMKGTLVVDAA